MITFFRNIDGARREVVVYTNQAEAERFDITPVPWRQKKGSADAGDWVICDDGYVAQVMRMGPKGKWIQTTVGYVSFSPASSLEAADRIRKRAWGRFTSKTNYEAKAARAGFKLFLRKMAMSRIMKVEPEDWQELGKLIYAKSRIPEATAKLALKSREVQDMIREEVRKILADNGLQEDAVVKMIKEGYDMAKSEKDAGNMLKAAFGLSEMLEMNPSKKAQMQLPPWAGGLPDDPDLIRTIEEAKAQVLPQLEQPVDTDGGEEYIQPDAGDTYVDPKTYIDGLAKENAK